MTLESMTLHEIGARLISLRDALGFPSQASFAVHIGVSPQALSNYEKGFRRPDLDVAIRISTKTGVTLDWIYQGNTAGLPVNIYNKLLEPTLRSATSGSQAQ